MIRRCAGSVLLLWCVSAHAQAVRSDGGAQRNGSPATAAHDDLSFHQNVRPGDSAQLGRTPHRNNAVDEEKVPTHWNVSTGENIRWSMPLGRYTHGSPTIANGKVYIGTSNGAGYLKRLPIAVDLGVLLCFRESDGQFLWQHSTEKLSKPGNHDQTQHGMCSTPVVEGERLWVVTNRGEVVCLDSEGFLDGEDDGVAKSVWTNKFDVRASFRALTLKPYYQDFPLEFKALLGPIAELQGFGASSEFTYERMADPQRWRTKLKADSAEVFQVEVTDSTLTLSGQGAFAGKQLSMSLDLFDGLDRGAVFPGLRAQFLAQGYGLSDEAVPKVIQPGQSWAVTASWRGIPVEFEIELILGTLHCRQKPTPVGDDEADVVWSFDMMKELGVLQLNMANCSPTIWGDVLFVCTSNSADAKRTHVPAPQVPSFLALDKHTGRVLWTDDSPGANILYGQWSSPAVGVFDGVAQVLFAGGDGWVYSFRADPGIDGKPEFLWKFDGNPKTAVYRSGPDGERSAFIATPVVHDGLVYLSMAEDFIPNRRKGRLWCIDPKKQGDVSPELVVDAAGAILPHRRVQPTEPVDGRAPRVVPNPNSAVIWQYSDYQENDGPFNTTLSQTIGAPAIRNGLLVVGDVNGVVHAVDARTGVPFWTCQMQKSWGSPLIVGNNVFVGDQSGVLAILALSDVPSRSIGVADKPGGRAGRPLKALRMGGAIYSTPAYANGVLFIASTNRLFAIGAKD